MWQGIACMSVVVALALMVGGAACSGAGPTAVPASTAESTSAAPAAGATGSTAAEKPSSTAAGSAAAADIWTDDFADAKASAKAEKKDLLLDFTGSDWCIWCKKLKAEVFDTDLFKAEAPKKFVLVVLDYPHFMTPAEPVRRQNAALQEQFGIEGFPTILLLDPDGRAYARIGYEEGGVKPYLAHLAELQKGRAERDKLIDQADKAKGVERAKLLDKAIEILGKGGIEPIENRPWLEEIVRLDEKNEAGLKAKYEKMLRLADVLKLAQADKPDEALKAADAMIAELKLAGQDLQDVLYLKALVLHARKDDAAARAALQAAFDAAPKSEKAEQIGAIIKQLDRQK